MTTIADIGIWLMVLASAIGGLVLFLVVIFSLMDLIERLVGHEIGEMGLIAVVSLLLGAIGAILWVIG